MGGVLILGALGSVALAALAAPWIGAVAAYFIAIFSPQSVWWWHFEGLRPVYWVLLPTCAGALIAAARGVLHVDALANVRTTWILVLWACSLVSLGFGPYVMRGVEHGLMDADFVFGNQTNTLLLMLLAGACVTDERRLKAVAAMLVGCALYMIWWANDRYLSGEFFYRLPGPSTPEGNGPYTDENDFAVFFVATTPFLWYLAFALRRGWMRWALWLAIPFGWHALFLTGSRGGLLGLGVVLLLIALRTRRRLLGALIVPAFVVAFAWQAGDTMKARAASIDEYGEDASASDRLVAWQAATRMMIANPLTGVGPGGFVRAYGGYAEGRPLQAHNTYFQIGAEYGPLAAVALLSLIGSCALGLRRVGVSLRRSDPGAQDGFLALLTEAALASLLGVLVCSMFLTLQLYALLYFLLFLSNAILFCASGRRGSARPAAAPQVAPFRKERHAGREPG